MKPQNILIFENPLCAKVADFGFSLIDDGSCLKLRAHSPGYEAPEWDQSATADLLKQTDVFSYGMIFVSIMIGKDVVAWVASEKGNIDAGIAILTELKKADKLLPYLIEAMYHLDDPTLDDYGLIVDIMNHSLRTDPTARSLEKIVSRLSLM